MSKSTIDQHRKDFSDRPLLICDVDEVIIEFLTPFGKFLNAQDKELRPNSFALDGNIFKSGTDIAYEKHIVRQLVDDFFADQHNWQTPVDHVHQALSNLSNEMDIFLLTAMPPEHFDIRKIMLKQHDLHYPLFATEDAKGPIINQLHDQRDHPIFFIDDMIFNLRSAREHVKNIELITIMANQEFKAIAPEIDAGIFNANSWLDVEKHIKSHLEAAS